MYDVLVDRNPVRMWGEGSGSGSLGLGPGLVRGTWAVGILLQMGLEGSLM